jgi:hypothetical protein
MAAETAQPAPPAAPKEYALSAAERAALEAQYALVTVAKAAVFDANKMLEMRRLEFQQALSKIEQMAQQSVVDLKEAEDRAAGSLTFLAESHGLPGASLSQDRSKLVLEEKK